MNKKAVYMNFPITVLKGAFKDIRGTIEKIMYYAIYKHSLMYDFGDEAKNMKASADFYRVGLSDIETSIRYGSITNILERLLSLTNGMLCRVAQKTAELHSPIALTLY